MPYGNLLADVVQSSTAGTPPQFNDGNGTQTGTLCRAWVNFNGSTAAIRASFNVSSVTRNSTGTYTLNFTNALADANYGINIQSTVSAAYTVGILNNVTYSTTAVQFVTVDFASGARDPSIVCASIFR